MEEPKIDLNSLIVVEQLPKIRETLSVISEEIDKEIETALSLDCTEESKTTVKQYRANLNKIKSSLEEKRKQVKEQIMKPYQEFEEIYNELIKDKLTNADKTLKERIDTIEITQREEKVKELLDFATEWVKFYELNEVIEPKQFIPNVTLSKSQKSLKEQIKEEIERVATETKIIKQEENPNEVLSYYLENGFDYPKAKLEVLNRHQKMKELENAIVDNQVEIIDSEIVVEEEISEPTILNEEDIIELIECEFKVLATKEQLIQIRNFLTELGVKYE